MRHKLEGGYSIMEIEHSEDGTALFSAYRGLTPLGTGFYKNRADAEMQIHLERKSTRYWEMSGKDGYFIQDGKGKIRKLWLPK
jgi:hypothetical protein